MELIAGPPLEAGAESLTAHRRRLGPLPVWEGPALLGQLDSSGLLGRGGAGFPVGRKWRAVAERAAGRAVVLVNGAEGELLSAKDRTLMAARPHLVIDGAMLAAGAVGADDIIFYVGVEQRAAEAALRQALAERSAELRVRTRLVQAPRGYLAGEESAAVHFVDAGDPRPTTTPPRPFERGVGGRPTLVQNVESLAVAALIARGQGSGIGLITLSGAVRQRGVREIELTSTLAEVTAAAGGLTRPVQAVLLGGYFGTWMDLDEIRALPLEPASLRARGLAFGCGVVHFLPQDSCGVDATARIMAYLASQSARQCGPCVFGLEAISGASLRLASLSPQSGDLERLMRWSGQLAGRGACRHPDGATGLLRSALEVFADDFAAHQRRTCLRTSARAVVAVA
jgi:NADH:ubiquinone oxidoreductase subunit F (NADH-binding)